MIQYEKVFMHKLSFRPIEIFWLFKREMYYERKMSKQRAEIEKLMAERQKLLSLQGELQRLHDNMPNRVMLIYHYRIGA